jgi:hypothetical protein
MRFTQFQVNETCILMLVPITLDRQFLYKIMEYSLKFWKRGPWYQYIIHRVGGGSPDGLMKFLEGQKSQVVYGKFKP